MHPLRYIQLLILLTARSSHTSNTDHTFRIYEEKCNRIIALYCSALAQYCPVLLIQWSPAHSDSCPGRDIIQPSMISGDLQVEMESTMLSGEIQFPILQLRGKSCDVLY